MTKSVLAVAPGPIWTPIPAQSFTPEMVCVSEDNPNHMAG